MCHNFFHDHIHEGGILDVEAPRGGFYLDMDRDTPVVLVGGGIGLTPVLSMVDAIVESRSKRETWFFYGLRNRSEHVLKEHLETIASEYENIHLQVCYSKPRNEDIQGEDYHHAERVSVPLFKRVLHSNNCDYYICGPGPMMNSITEGLTGWGVPEENVHFEAFGPASVKKTQKREFIPAKDAGPIEITFASLGNTSFQWEPNEESILEFAESNEIAIDSGCRAGSCGTCSVVVMSGEVSYVKDPETEGEEGECLTCIAIPKGNLVLDA